MARLAALLALCGSLLPTATAPAEPTPSPAPGPTRSPPPPTPVPHATTVGEGLLQACALGRQSIVDAVITRERADPLYADARGYSCLHIAAQYGHTDVLRSVLRHGGERMRERRSVDRATEHGNTPLHLAAGNNQPAAMRVLLLAGANRTALNHEGERPVDVAIKVIGAAKAEQILRLVLQQSTAELEAMDAEAKERWLAQHQGEREPHIAASPGEGPKRLMHVEEPKPRPQKGVDEVDVRRRGKGGKPPPPPRPRRPFGDKREL